MTDEEYERLKHRLIEDFWAWVGHTSYQVALWMMEWTLKAAGAAWPIILAWMRKNGYLDV